MWIRQAIRLSTRTNVFQRLCHRLAVLQHCLRRLRLAGKLLCGYLLLIASSFCALACQYPVQLAELGYFAYRDKDQKLHGILPDLIDLIASETGCRLEYNSMPLRRLRETNRFSTFAIYAPIVFSPTPDSHEIPLLRHQLTLLSLTLPDHVTAKEILHKRDAPIGILRGAGYGPWVTNWIDAHPAQIDYSDSLESIYRKIAARRNLATFGFAPVYRYWLDQLGYRSNFQAKAIDEAPEILSYISFSSKQITAKDLRHLTQALKTIRDDGRLEEICAHYLGKELAAQQMWHPGSPSPNRAKPSQSQKTSAPQFAAPP